MSRSLYSVRCGAQSQGRLLLILNVLHLALELTDVRSSSSLRWHVHSRPPQVFYDITFFVTGSVRLPASPPEVPPVD